MCVSRDIAQDECPRPLRSERHSVTLPLLRNLKTNESLQILTAS